MVYHKASTEYPEGWYADPIRNMEDDLLADDQNYLIKKILTQIPDELLGQLAKEQVVLRRKN